MRNIEDGHRDRNRQAYNYHNIYITLFEYDFTYQTRVSGPRPFSAGRDVIEDAFMRAHIAQRNADSELREFVPEDALPNEVLSDLLREWSLPAMTTIWAVLDDEDAETVPDELAGVDRRQRGFLRPAAAVIAKWLAQGLLDVPCGALPSAWVS